METRQPDTLFNKSLFAVVHVVYGLSKWPEAFQDIQNYVESIPGTLADEFTAMIMPNLRSPSLQLVQICVHPGIRKLDMASWKASLQKKACTVLPRLKHLKRLTLSTKANNLWLSPNLVSFTYPCNCTNSVIRDLAQSCKNLQELSIYGAAAVTDHCTNFLLQLQELQELNVSYTQISARACAKLLFGLHKLKKWWGSSIQDPVFEGISESMKTYTSLKLKGRVHLAYYFPNLTHLTVTEVVMPEALATLGTLKRLEHVTLMYPHDYGLGMREFMNVQGKNLLTIQIYHVLNLDFVHFATMSPQLQKFRMEDCFISVEGLGAKRSLPHFKSVEVLEVEANEEWSNSGFKFPFYDYSNLQHLTTTNVTQIDDASMRHAVLQKGWLNELRTLSMNGSLGYLSAKTFIQILNHCPNLKRITNLGAWKGLSQEDYNIIQMLNERRLVDISIMSYA